MAGTDFVRLADLRNLTPGLSRSQFDAAVQRLASSRMNSVASARAANPRSVTAADRRSAVNTGMGTVHQLRFTARPS